MRGHKLKSPRAFIYAWVPEDPLGFFREFIVFLVGLLNNSFFKVHNVQGGARSSPVLKQMFLLYLKVGRPLLSPKTKCSLCIIYRYYSLERFLVRVELFKVWCLSFIWGSKSSELLRVPVTLENAVFSVCEDGYNTSCMFKAWYAQGTPRRLVTPGAGGWGWARLGRWTWTGAGVWSHVGLPWLARYFLQQP